MARSALIANPTSLSSPNSPTSKGSSSATSRGRQLWNMAVDSVLEHEQATPANSSVASSAGGGDATGWYNLTMRYVLTDQFSACNRI